MSNIFAPGAGDSTGGGGNIFAAPTPRRHRTTPSPEAAPEPQANIFAGATTHTGKRGSKYAGDPLAAAANTAKGIATKPLEAIDAFLGAPERGVEGTLAGFQRSNGNVLGALGHGAYEVFHPRDTKTRDENLGMVEQKLGLPKATGIGKAAEDFGAQTLLDPLSYLPLIGEGRWLERGAQAVGHALPSALKSNESVAQVAHFFRANPQIDQALSKEGANIYRGVYSSERARASAEAQKDALILGKDRNAIKNGGPTPNFDRRLDELAYVHGDPEMRAQVEQRGIFKPTPEQAAQAPTGFLPHYDLLEDYFPQFEAKSMTQVAEPLRVKQYAGEAATPYAKERTTNSEALSDPFDRAQKRLALAQARIFEKSVDKRLIDELGQRNASDLSGIDQLRAEGRGLGQESVTGFKPLNWLSNAYRQALFVNPLPHMFNIARLAYLAGGAKTVGRGLGYMAFGAPKHIAEETAKYVGTPTYLSEHGGIFDKIPGLKAWRDMGQNGLTAFDRAMRQSYLAELKGGKAATYEMGQKVRQGIGDYDASSRAVQIARAAGAPFAQWRLGVVPGAIGRATLQHPERVERYARGMTDLSKNTVPFQFSGPEEDFGRLASAPYGTARYIMSPSTIGPVLSQLHSLAGFGSTPTIRATAEQLLRSYVPGGGSLEELFGLSPYKEGDKPTLNFLLSLVGGYTQPTAAK